MAGRIGARRGDRSSARATPTPCRSRLNPLEPEPGFPAADPHRPGPGAVPGRLRRRRAVPAGAAARADPVLRGPRLGPGPRRATPSRAGAVPVPDARRPAAAPPRTWSSDIGYGKEVTADVRGFIDVRLRQPAPRHARPVLRGRPSRSTSPTCSGATSSSRSRTSATTRTRRSSWATVLIRIVEHLAAATAGATEPASCATSPSSRRRTGCCSAASGSPAAARGRAVRRPARRDPRVRRGHRRRRADPHQARPRRHQEHRAEGRAPAARPRRPRRRRRHHEPRRRRSPEYLVTLPPGRAAVFADGMDRPLLVAMPLGEERETARNATRAVAVTRRRSPACGAECQARPCTLREMTAARHLADDPRLVLWLELLTVAHLVGEAEPRPDDGLAAGALAAGRPAQAELRARSARASLGRRPLRRLGRCTTSLRPWRRTWPPGRRPGCSATACAATGARSSGRRAGSAGWTSSAPWGTRPCPRTPRIPRPRRGGNAAWSCGGRPRRAASRARAPPVDLAAVARHHPRWRPTARRGGHGAAQQPTRGGRPAHRRDRVPRDRQRLARAAPVPGRVDAAGTATSSRTA